MPKKKPQKKINPLVIESQETLGEVRNTSASMIRLSRVKYEGNDLTFIDIRHFSRGWGGEDGDQDVFHPTRKGVQMKESDFLKLIEPLFDTGVAAPPRKVH